MKKELTCKTCKHKKKCSGKVSKHSSKCDNLRHGIIKPKQEQYGCVLRSFYGDKKQAFLKYIQFKK